LARLPKTRWGQVDPGIQRVFEAFWTSRGNVPKLFRILAHRPPLFETFTAHFDAVMGEGRLPIRFKELVAVRVSQLNGCRYCLGSHTVLAKKFGATDAELASLQDVAASSLSEAERDSILFAEKMTRDHRSIRQADFDRLRAHWETDQIVELLCVIGIFNYLNRFAESLALEPTQPGEGGPDDREGAQVG